MQYLCFCFDNEFEQICEIFLQFTYDLRNILEETVYIHSIAENNRRGDLWHWEVALAGVAKGSSRVHHHALRGVSPQWQMGPHSRTLLRQQ